MTGLRSSCGACKFLRRKCNNGCVFAPYFCYDQGATHFAAVHKVFGASNVSKLLSHLPMHSRSEAAITISYEALARMGDPIYGCVAHIFALQQQVAKLQEEIEFLEIQVTDRATNVFNHQSPQAMNGNSTSGFQFPSPQDSINLPNYCNQAVPVPNYCNQVVPDPALELNATGNLSLCNDTNIQLSPLDKWEDHSLFFNSTNETNSLQSLPMGMDQHICPCDPWLDNSIYNEH